MADSITINVWLSTRLAWVLQFDSIKWECSPAALKDQRALRCTYRILIFFFRTMSSCISSGIKDDCL